MRWPRASTVSRQGVGRRRTFAAAGAALVVLALAGAGAVVTESGGAAPALTTEQIMRDPSGAAAGGTGAPSAAPDPLTTGALLTTADLAGAVPARWALGTTSGDGDTGSGSSDSGTDSGTDSDVGTGPGTGGPAFTCQTTRWADPQHLGALLRTFTATATARAGGALTAGQSVEASTDDTAAQATYSSTLDAFAGCAGPRVQLTATDTVSGVGDQAALLVLRSWRTPQRTEVVGVARTGRLTTTVVSTQTDRAGTAAIDLATRATLLGTAVTGLCTLPGHGACTTSPAAQAALPFPVGDQPGLLDGVDLPPVAGVAAPWVGSDPVAATDNAAATRCDDSDFIGSGFTGAVTRTFVIPRARRLPTEFGLTETAGTAPVRRARAFVATVRRKLAGCHDKDLGTKVVQIESRSTPDGELAVWRLDVELSKKRVVHFQMAIIRSGGSVAQLTFVPSGAHTVAGTDFAALAVRAQQRLAYLIG